MKMELKDALDLAIFLFGRLSVASDNILEELECGRGECLDAEKLLREGSERVEDVIEEIEAQKCSKCGLPNIGCRTTCKCGNFMGFSRWKDMVKWNKTYTTHDELKIIEVTSDPVFVEIGNNND